MPPSDHPWPAGRSVQLRSAGQPARILPDEVDGGWVLEIGGIEQSHVDLVDPSQLRHEYLRRMANVLDAFRPAGRPIHIAHLGAGALTLPRYVQRTRPGSRQLVVEIERELPTFVMTALPLPAGTDLEVSIGDAREELAAMPGELLDAIVLDVFSGETSPVHLAGEDFYAEALSHLDERGVLLVNVGDDAGRRFAARQARALENATTEHGLPGVWTLTDSTLLTRRQAGNWVFAAGGALAAPEIEQWRDAWLAAGPHPAAVLDPEETAAAVIRIGGTA